jgi:acyl-CoA thioesterase
VPGDVLAPAVVEGLGRQDGWFFVITLQLSMQWFAPMRGAFLCQQTRAHHAGDGFATGVAELWSEDRTLVAIATQSALLQTLKVG